MAMVIQQIVRNLFNSKQLGIQIDIRLPDQIGINSNQSVFQKVIEAQIIQIQ
jgi:hypothetical protein